MISNIPKLDYIDAKLVMTDLYETEFGIYNHLSSSNSRPLASVAMFDCEDINTDSLLEESIRTYVSKGIKDIYGLSLIEFLELPIDVIRMMFDIASDEQAKKNKTLSELESQFKK